MTEFIVGFVFCLVLLAAGSGFGLYHLIRFTRRHPHRLRTWAVRLQRMLSDEREPAVSQKGRDHG